VKQLDVTTVVREELMRIAPDIDFASVDPRRDLREEFDIDSMDFLNLVTALHQRMGVDIPEADYPKFSTLAGAVAFLQRKIEGAP